MDGSFTTYRRAVSNGSDSDGIIDDSFTADNSFTINKHVGIRSAKKNQTAYVAESEESESDEGTVSYDEDVLDKVPDVVATKSSNFSSYAISSSSNEDISRQNASRRSSSQRPSNSPTNIVSTSSDEEVSPEVVPRRRPLIKKCIGNKQSESPLIRRVKRRMILTDSENDNSILVEKDSNTKLQCLKDTPAKIDVADNKYEEIRPKNLACISDDDDSDGAVSTDYDKIDEIVESNDCDDDLVNENDVVTSRISTTELRSIDLATDESDAIQTDESNLKSRKSSGIGLTSSSVDVPDSELTTDKSPVEIVEEIDNLDISKISCSTFGSPTREDSINVANDLNEIESEQDKVEVLEIKSPVVVKNNLNKKNFIEDDDDVTIVDREPEIIALSSDDDEPLPAKRSPRSSKTSKDDTSYTTNKAQVQNNGTMKQYLLPSSYPNQGVVYVKKHVRENEMSKLNGLQQDLHNIRGLLENMDLETLPDGGVKLMERLTLLEKDVRRQAEKVANMVVEPDNPTIEDIENDGFGDGSTGGLTWDDIQKVSNQVQPRMFGKQAMSTHMAERSLIMERLRDLHESLGSRPPETTQATPPRGLRSELMPHQLHALAWLRWRETQKPAGGILADDMGLGKTLTMIALILSTKQDNLDEDDDERDQGDWKDKENTNLVRGGTLVVCPASVLHQWAGEVTKHCTSHALSVCLHHGAARAKKPFQLGNHDIVITTYNLLQREAEKRGVLTRVHWSRVILDEAHIVRNHKSATSVAVSALTAKRRWALTGTPVQNKDLDVFALLKFLRCTPFGDLTVWKKWIDNKSLGGQERLSTIMRCLLLRRTKQSLQLDGQLGCLPERTEHQLPVTLTKDEMNVYQKVLVFSKTLFAKFLHQRAEREGDSRVQPPAPGKDDAYAKMHRRMVALQGAKPVKSHEILVLLMRLRQVCCHCGLIAAMLDGREDLAEAEEDPGSLDLLAELKKMSLEDANNDRRKSEHEKDDDKEPEVGTTVAEALRSVMSPNNPVFDLGRPSSKIKTVMECLEKNVFVNKGDKAVVVSQWTSVLGLVERELKQRRVRCVTLSGQVPVPKRPPLIDALNDPNSDVKVMLLSLCAGGVGLNLVGASHLLLLDPHWNPQLEQQAQDRVYRVGQRKPVNIYRFMCLDTVEQSIRKLQKEKLELANNVLTGAKHTNSSPSIEDLRVLFNMGM